VAEAADVLDAYLRLDARLFSWKNTFGWNDVAPLEPQIQSLVDRLSAVLKHIKVHRQGVADLDGADPERPFLEQFYALFGNYAEALKFAIQGMARVLSHVATRRANRSEFKQVRYESDLVIYKSQVDKYQLYGQQLNPLLKRL
jgi:hypothetical protein